MSTDSDASAGPPPTKGAVPAPVRRHRPSDPPNVRRAHPVVVVLGCAAGIAVGIGGAGVTLLMTVLLSESVDPITTSSMSRGEPPLTFALINLLPIGAACLWMRRLLRPRPPWAISMGVAYIAAIVWFVGSAL